MKVPQDQADAGTRPKQTKSEKDILQELFGLPQTENKPPDPFEEPRTVRKEEDVYEEVTDSTWNPEDDFDDASEIGQNQSTFKPQYTEDYTNVSPEKVALSKSSDSLIHLDSNQAVAKVTESVNKRAIQIRKLFENKDTVRNSILIAEILNKPKAYRFRGNDLPKMR